ncbi:hypothetical protein, partial [Anabaena cylindrica]|uniref:hypothetical protein n=1 Tax=Anabaena cylindrica TaxID=1165 RepID=UPI001A7F042F
FPYIKKFANLYRDRVFNFNNLNLSALNFNTFSFLHKRDARARYYYACYIWQFQINLLLLEE